MVTIPIGTEASYLKLWISYQIMILQMTTITMMISLKTVI